MPQTKIADRQLKTAPGGSSAATPVLVATVPYNVASGDEVIFVDTNALVVGSSTWIINLGSAAGRSKPLTVTDIGNNAATVNIVINAANGETINGQSSLTLFNNGQSVTLFPDGNATYFIVGSANAASGVAGRTAVSVTFSGDGFAQTTVTGISWANNSRNYLVNPIASANHTVEEVIAEQVAAQVGNIIDGTGFTLYASAPLPCLGAYLFEVTGI